MQKVAAELRPRPAWLSQIPRNIRLSPCDATLHAFCQFGHLLSQVSCRIKIRTAAGRLCRSKWVERQHTSTRSYKASIKSSSPVIHFPVPCAWLLDSMHANALAAIFASA